MVRFILLLTLIILQKTDAQCYLYPSLTPTLSHLKNIIGIQPDSGIALIDCIYVINLDERPEKWKVTADELKMHSLQALRFSAINGWKLSLDTKIKLFGPYTVNLREGHIGCLLSHLSVVYDAYKKNYHHIWVTEDDIKINESPAILEDLLVRLSSIDPEWDLFFTDPDTKNSKGETVISWDVYVRPDQPTEPVSYYRKRTVIDDDLMKIGQRFGMYSVIISNRGIQKIIDYFSHVYLWSPIDIDIFYIPGIRVYAARRDIVTVNWQIPISDTTSPPLEKEIIDDLPSDTMPHPFSAVPL